MQSWCFDWCIGFVELSYTSVSGILTFLLCCNGMAAGSFTTLRSVQDDKAAAARLLHQKHYAL